MESTKKVLPHLLFVLLFVTLVTSVHASITVQAQIDQHIHVAFDLENINSTIYWMVKNENLITESTIPTTIRENLEQQNLNNVDVFDEQIDFNDPTSSIHIMFSLTGSDILNFTVNTKSMTKTYHARTDWRKFEVNLTSDFSLNFTEYFGRPVENWQRINYTLDAKTHPAFYHDVADLETFDPTFYFLLPVAATNVEAIGDTIVFKLSLPLGDSLLNSPFLILGALIVVSIALFLYRRIRK